MSGKMLIKTLWRPRTPNQGLAFLLSSAAGTGHDLQPSKTANSSSFQSRRGQERGELGKNATVRDLRTDLFSPHGLPSWRSNNLRHNWPADCHRPGTREGYVFSTRVDRPAEMLKVQQDPFLILSISLGGSAHQSRLPLLRLRLTLKDLQSV